LLAKYALRWISLFWNARENVPGQTLYFYWETVLKNRELATNIPPKHIGEWFPLDFSLSPHKPLQPLVVKKGKIVWCDCVCNWKSGHQGIFLWKKIILSSLVSIFESRPKRNHSPLCAKLIVILHYLIMRMWIIMQCIVVMSGIASIVTHKPVIFDWDHSSWSGCVNFVNDPFYSPFRRSE